MRARPAAGVCAARRRGAGGAAGCQTSVKGGQELPRREWTRNTQAFVTLKIELFFCSFSSPKLYPSLCELAHVLSVDGPVRQRLDSLSGELAKAADKELQAGSRGGWGVDFVGELWLTSPSATAAVCPQVIVDSMVSLCRELCPLSSSAAERLSPPLSSISERVSVPRSSIRTALMERAAQDVHRTLE